VIPPKEQKGSRVGGRLAEALLPGQPHVAEAAALLAGLPDFSKAASRELHGACALVYSSAPLGGSIHAGAAGRPPAGGRHSASGMLSYFARRGQLNSAQRIGLVDISIPTLRHMSREQYEVFRNNVKSLVEADGEISLF